MLISALLLSASIQLLTHVDGAFERIVSMKFPRLLKHWLGLLTSCAAHALGAIMTWIPAFVILNMGGLLVILLQAIAGFAIVLAVFSLYLLFRAIKWSSYQQDM